jgi:hypothetical protein
MEEYKIYTAPGTAGGSVAFFLVVVAVFAAIIRGILGLLAFVLGFSAPPFLIVYLLCILGGLSKVRFYGGVFAILNDNGIYFPFYEAHLTWDQVSFHEGPIICRPEGADNEFFLDIDPAVYEDFAAAVLYDDDVLCCDYSYGFPEHLHMICFRDRKVAQSIDEIRKVIESYKSRP